MFNDFRFIVMAIEYTSIHTMESVITSPIAAWDDG